MIEPKDVVVGVLEASSAMAGFVLVFLGVIVAAYQTFPGGVPGAAVRPYRAMGASLLSTFGLSLAAVAASLSWLVDGGPLAWYGAVITLFAVQLLAVLAAAVWATRVALWR